jgi:uncharacterized protein (DUF4415 family)
MSRKLKEPVFDDDNPEWTEADFARAAKWPAGVRLQDVTPAELARIVKKRGPQKAPTKVAVSIRLSPEVISYFKAKGPGWQSRIDTALRKIARKAS